MWTPNFYYEDLSKIILFPHGQGEGHGGSVDIFWTKMRGGQFL